MATLIQLAHDGKLIKIDPQLGPQQQEFRVMYATPRLAKWLASTLPGLSSSWNIETPPIEQLDALLEEYTSGKPLVVGHQFKAIHHVKCGVWELKTADLRIFGWFHAKDCFVGHVGNLTETIKLHKLYHGHAGEVAHFREQLDLDDPKFITGTQPDDVITTFTYPK